MFGELSPDEADPDLEETDAEPPQQLLLSEQHGDTQGLSIADCSCSFVTDICRPLMTPVSTCVKCSSNIIIFITKKCNQPDLLPSFCQPFPRVAVAVFNNLVCAKIFPEHDCVIQVRKIENLRI